MADNALQWNIIVMFDVYCEDKWCRGEVYQVMVLIDLIGRNTRLVTPRVELYVWRETT